jgi:hypothetical protein
MFDRDLIGKGLPNLKISPKIAARISEFWDSTR